MLLSFYFVARTKFPNYSFSFNFLRIWVKKRQLYFWDFESDIFQQKSPARYYLMHQNRIAVCGSCGWSSLQIPIGSSWLSRKKLLMNEYDLDYMVLSCTMRYECVLTPNYLRLSLIWHTQNKVIWFFKKKRWKLYHKKCDEYTSRAFPFKSMPWSSSASTSGTSASPSPSSCHPFPHDGSCKGGVHRFYL